MNNNSTFPTALFAKLLCETPTQPATNLWRALELEIVIQKAFPRLTSCKTLLDLGCGDGSIMAYLRNHLPPTLYITGLDADPEETKLAEARHVYNNVICSGAEKIPLKESSVEALFSNSVLEHIKPIDDVLIECSRVLQSGGWFIATVPGPNFHASLSGPCLPWKHRQEYLDDLDARLAHWRYWSINEWRLHLDAVGMDLIGFEEYLSADVMQRWEVISRLTGGLLYTLLGKKKKPIAIQRLMGLRKKFHLSTYIATPLAWLLSRCLKLNGSPHGCLLLIGKKR